jgi:hypothetical protein
VLYPENWPEMVNMCANVFSTQGKSQFGFFMNMAPHLVQTFFDPKNFSNNTLAKTYNRQTVPKPMQSNTFWNVDKFNSGQQNQGSAPNFKKRFPRRSASFAVVPKVGSNHDPDEDVSFESLQIGPKM